MLFPLILALILIFYVFLSKRSAVARKKPGSLLKDLYLIIKNETGYPSLLFSCVLSVSVLYVLYLLFYHYSSIIWSLNSKVLPLADYTPWIRKTASEHDGIEIYVLYALTSLSIIIAFLTNKLFSRINNRSVVRSFFMLFSIISIIFFANVNFYPPMAAPAQGLNSAGFTMLILFIMLVLSFLFMKDRRMINIILPLLIIPICLVPTSGILFNDYNYILTPALKLLHGCKTTDIYFQYDHLLSLLAVLWLKSGLGIYSFRILGQISYLALFTGIYLFGQKYFANKLYALFLLISLVIIRIYGQIYDPTISFQVAPLRLDLWFILLLLAYWKGLMHWSLGLTLGILIIAHHNFGLIYAGSYLLLIFILGILEAAESTFKIKRVIKKYFLLYSVNIYMLIFALIAYNILFTSNAPNSVASLHGFLTIAKSSFYWYVPIMLSLIVILIIKNRKRLSERYFITALFMIILTIGNSLYFYGRSHENNLINISASLLFCLFLLFDLLDRELKKDTSPRIRKLFMPTLAIVFILTCAYYYSGRAMGKVQSQYLHFKNWQFIEAYPAPDMQAIQRMTRYSSKVIFLSETDLLYYYYGGYVPQGKYHTYAWVIKKGLIDFLNKRLNAGYYVIIPDTEYKMFSEIIDGLNIKNKKDDSGFLFISNNIDPWIYLEPGQKNINIKIAGPYKTLLITGRDNSVILDDHKLQNSQVLDLKQGRHVVTASKPAVLMVEYNPEKISDSLYNLNLASFDLIPLNKIFSDKFELMGVIKYKISDKLFFRFFWKALADVTDELMTFHHFCGSNGNYMTVANVDPTDGWYDIRSIKKGKEFSYIFSVDNNEKYKSINIGWFFRQDWSRRLMYGDSTFFTLQL